MISPILSDNLPRLLEQQTTNLTGLSELHSAANAPIELMVELELLVPTITQSNVSLVATNQLHTWGDGSELTSRS